MGSIEARPDQFEPLERLLRDFFLETPRTITSSKRLAELMAGKAAMIKDVIGKAMLHDIEAKRETDLTGQLAAFKEHLIHDIAVEEFADIYAETIAYGLFAARLHDETLDTFSRTEALELLPKSNPFLRSLFGYIAGPDLDDRISWIIDDLARIFLACDLKLLMADFGKLTGQNDPFLHFYETFLAAYNPAKRKARGVWYTPEPVVNFIVRAVDEVLKTEFGLKDGLADTSKIKVEVETGQQITNKDGTIKKRGGGRATETKDVHRVQILDPATGTGTFLAEVIKLIAPRIKGVAPGMWSSYVETELIPRLHGFELLMASYAMCHMKLDMILTELGYKPTGNPPRLSVYLTNSLEEGERVEQNLFAQWFTREAKGANAIKRDTPVMCVIGNPPYSGISQNMGPWISGLIDDYKYVDGEHFGERKHWLHDDYVKFIRFAEHLIEKNGEGVLGFITNHGYLDNPTFRGMRWHLMKTFDKIYVLDLHGNSKKKEVSPDGSPDKNVFDIQQGVAIIIGVKKKATDGGPAKIVHKELWGTRSVKYESLAKTRTDDPEFSSIEAPAPQYAFVKRDYERLEVYQAGFSLPEMMPQNVTGVVTARDGLVIAHSEDELTERVSRLVDPSKSDAEVRTEFFASKKAGKYLPGDSRGWRLSEARAALQASDWQKDIAPIAYRPFDTRRVLYRPDMVDWGRFDHMANMTRGNNFALLTSKAHRDDAFRHVLLTENISEVIGLSPRTASNSISFPLYLYPAEDELDQSRKVNFDPKLYAKIQKLATHPDHGVPDEVAVFDYIYGVLHSPDYRQTFAEFLKIDFPRIPWPASPDVFWSVAEKGEQLRRLHLMEEEAVGTAPYPLEGSGGGEVEAKFPKFEATSEGLGEVWINGAQRFTGVPQISWEFYIGGYQPAQKWLKDRRGRTLSFDDIRHYQNIIKILSETDRIMKQIELPLDVETGGPEDEA